MDLQSPRRFVTSRGRTLSRLMFVKTNEKKHGNSQGQVSKDAGWIILTLLQAPISPKVANTEGQLVSCSLADWQLSHSLDRLIISHTTKKHTQSCSLHLFSESHHLTNHHPTTHPTSSGCVSSGPKPPHP